MNREPRTLTAQEIETSWNRRIAKVSPGLDGLSPGWVLKTALGVPFFQVLLLLELGFDRRAVSINLRATVLYTIYTIITYWALNSWTYVWEDAEKEARRRITILLLIGYRSLLLFFMAVVLIAGAILIAAGVHPDRTAQTIAVVILATSVGIGMFILAWPRFLISGPRRRLFFPDPESVDQGQQKRILLIIIGVLAILTIAVSPGLFVFNLIVLVATIGGFLFLSGSLTELYQFFTLGWAAISAVRKRQRG